MATTRVLFQPYQKVSSIRTCKTCKHYLRTQKCSLYGRISLLTGDVYNVSVLEMREYEELCGEVGKYWIAAEKGETSELN